MTDIIANGIVDVVLDDSPLTTPVHYLSASFCSVATSVGPETAGSTGYRYVVKASDVFLDNEEEEEDDEDGTLVEEETEEEETEEEETLDEEVLAARAEAQRRHALVHGPSRANFTHDRQSLQAVRQNQLNNFVLRHSTATQASRQDHHIMLRQLIGEAYNRDLEHRAHRPQWKRIIAAVRKEYWGANAIFTLSPDPYHTVLAKLSSMMLWDDEVRHWPYAYSEDELARRRERQSEVLAKLQSTNGLFL